MQCLNNACEACNRRLGLQRRLWLPDHQPRYSNCWLIELRALVCPLSKGRLRRWLTDWCVMSQFLKRWLCVNRNQLSLGICFSESGVWFSQGWSPFQYCFFCLWLFIRLLGVEGWYNGKDAKQTCFVYMYIYSRSRWPKFFFWIPFKMYILCVSVSTLLQYLQLIRKKHILMITVS